MMHQCCCVLVYRYDNHTLSCLVTVESNDDPFCPDCANRHPEFDTNAVTVTAALPKVRIEETKNE